MSTSLMIFGAVFFILFAILEGEREAARDSHGGSQVRYPFNIHGHYVSVRALVSFLCILITQSPSKLWVPLLVSHILIFPFFHDGMYYTTRKIIEPRHPDLKKYHWFGKSDTTTAKFSFGPIARTIFMLLGAALYVGAVLYGKLI